MDKVINIPLNDLKIAVEKRQQKLLLSHLLSLFQELSQLPPELIILCGFFSLRSQSDPIPTLPAGFYLLETIPSRLHFHRNSAFPKENLDLCGRAILGSFLERSRSPEIAFFWV